jgi:hypothetical protein
LGASSTTSKTLGLIREAFFYKNLAKDLKAKIPLAYYAHADEKTGEKVIIMEDISGHIQAGYYFGPGNPNNWGKDLSVLTAARALQTKNVARSAFVEAAKLHAGFWKN